MIVVVQAPTGGVSKESIGLGNVDNTSDLEKPISEAAQTALDTKPAEAPADGETYARKNEAWVALGVPLSAANVFSATVGASQSTVDFTVPSSASILAPLGIEKPGDGYDDIGILSVARINPTTARAYLTADTTASNYKARILAL